LIHLPTGVLMLVLALDGESVNNNNTGLAVISIVSMAFGYVLLALVWRFVFSAKARRKRGERPDGE
jgi:chromate transport protein ChrA